MRTKPKLKDKGKKLYRNTHGHLNGLVPSYGLARIILGRKTLRKLKAQLSI